MPDHPVLTCRCGHRHIGSPLLHPGIPSLHVCPMCGSFVVVREQGEMASKDDRADPQEWGPLG